MAHKRIIAPIQSAPSQDFGVSESFRKLGLLTQKRGFGWQRNYFLIDYVFFNLYLLTSMELPADDFILLSLINTKLRDEYSSLNELAEEEGVDVGEIFTRLNTIGFSYNEELNTFK